MHGTVTARSASEIARFFVWKADEEDELLSHLKLQKLLYYTQGFHLAMFDGDLFSEDVLHWKHGPVVREVWDEYKRYGGSGIPHDGEGPQIDDESTELLEEIWRVYGQFSAWRLREMSHQTDPWSSTVENAVISKESMRKFFLTQL